MPNFSTPGNAQLHAVDDPDGFLTLVLMDHPSFAGGIRLVDDTRDWTIDGTAFIGLPMRMKLPQDVAGEATRAQLAIDNIGRDVTAELEHLPPGSSLEVTIRIVSRKTPSRVEWEYTAGGSTATVDVEFVTLSLGDDDLLRRNAVALRYDPTTAPGIFSD